jgi:hypothetical protein
VIAQIVQSAIWDKLKVLGRLKTVHGDETLSELLHGDLEGGANVVDLADLSLVQDGIVGTNNIGHKEERTLGLTLTVKGASLLTLQQADKLGDNLFGELVGSIDVVRTSEDDGEAERLVVRENQMLGTGLGGGVRVGGLQDGLLESSILVGGLTVNLIGRNVQEALDTACLGALDENVGSENVVLRELNGVTERVIYDEKK